MNRTAIQLGEYRYALSAWYAVKDVMLVWLTEIPYFDLIFHFKCRMEKRKLFIWKEAHEKLLISEVLQDEPYEFKEGSKERGACWTRISERLTQAGIEAEYGEVDQALQDISERMDEMEEERENEKKKVKKERANA